MFVFYNLEVFFFPAALDEADIQQQESEDLWRVPARLQVKYKYKYTKKKLKIYSHGL